MRAAQSLPALIGTLFVCSTAGAALDIGDRAPALKLDKWVKGDPAALEQGRGTQVYVVEFWATWIGPCRTVIPVLSDLQNRHRDKGLVVIGVSDESVETVAAFVRGMGERISYYVACDVEQETHRAFMAAAGVSGVPYAFVIDKTGRIAWHCHPMDGLEQVVEAIVGGSFDINAAIDRRMQLQRLGGKLAGHFQAKQWDAALAVAEEAHRLDGNSMKHHYLRFQCLAKKGDEQAARAAGEAFLALAREASALNAFAWELLTEPAYGGRYHDLALRAAKKADEACRGQEWPMLGTYARARFETGDVEGAVQTQERAVELAEKEKAKYLDKLRETLARYRQAARSSRPQGK